MGEREHEKRKDKKKIKQIKLRPTSKVNAIFAFFK